MLLKNREQTQTNLKAFHSGYNSQTYLFYLEDVSVRFKNVTALQSVHLAVQPREILFVTGPSGAGKSTLFKVIAGHVQPTSGEFRNLVSKEKGHFLTCIFQDLKLMREWSCLDNLLLAYDPKLYTSRKEFESEVEEYCRYFSIQSQVDSKINSVNGGLRQITAIIRCLLSRPTVILADEPTSALDKDNARKLYEIFHYLNAKKGTTILWASHNRELVKQFTGRTVHIDRGKIIHTGHACFI